MRNPARFAHDADMIGADADRIRSLIVQLRLLHAQTLAVRVGARCDGGSPALDCMDAAAAGIIDTISDLDRNPARVPRWGEGRMNRRFCSVERGVGGFLPPFRCDPLPKVSLWVHEADPD